MYMDFYIVPYKLFDYTIFWQIISDLGKADTACEYLGSSRTAPAVIQPSTRLRIMNSFLTTHILKFLNK
jgi:hypothetical protein